MLIIVIGTTCSGKHTLLNYITSHGFTPLELTPSSEATGSIVGSSSALAFSSAEGMLDFVTQNWRSNFITISLSTRADLEPFIKRPFVLLVNVDAPTLTRWKRHVALETSIAKITPSLQDFLAADDLHLWGKSGETVAERHGNSHKDVLSALPHLSAINDFDTVEAFHRYLGLLNLFDPDRLRPAWDSYFMTLSELASKRSNCMKRRVGAVLVRNQRIVATGYNGTPRGLLNCNEGGCSRCNSLSRSGESLSECLCLHAEENALLEAGRERVGEGAVLYCNTCPCLRCTVKIVQTGVKEVVYNFSYSMDEASAKVFAEAGVRLRQHSPPK